MFTHVRQAQELKDGEGMITHVSQVQEALHLAILRSHLGYASQLWAPQSIELLKKSKMCNGELQSTS